MKYITYKGIQISKLSLGTVQFGIDYGIANSKGKPNQNSVNKIIEYVVSRGINSFDTAQGYGDSEKVIGNYFGITDSEPILAVSKIDSKKLLLSERDFNELIQSSVNQLNVNSLFGLLMHNSDLMNVWIEKYTTKIDLLKSKNIIKYFGVSIYTNQEFEMAINNEDIDIIQIPFSVFDQRAISNKWFEKAKEKNKLIFIRSIYLQGLLLMDIQSIPVNLVAAKEYIKKLDKMCKDLQVTKNELCLSFVNTVAEEASLLFGCETLSQAKQNLDVFENMNMLEKNIINDIIENFQDMPEHIYNPTKW